MEMVPFFVRSGSCNNQCEVMVARGQGAGGGLELTDVVLFCVFHALPFSSYRSARVESSECPCLLAGNLFSINYKTYKGMFLGNQAKSFISGELCDEHVENTR